jgi:flagellar hook-associated protein 3 FlgL
MKVTDNSTYRLMQTNLDRITNDLLTLRNQGATGLKLTKASDDPGAIRPVLTTRSQLQQNSRYLETMGMAGDKMAATDGYLSQIENTLVRAKEIAINAVNGSLSSTDLATLGDEVAQLRNQLLDAANASVDGKFIFAGYQEKTRPFTENPTYDPALYNVSDVTTWPYLYNGDSNPTQLEITPGEFLRTNLTGNELFMGITNEIAATGYATPYQGETMTSGPLLDGAGSGPITITTGATPPVVTNIAAASLTDTDNNYAAKVLGLFIAGPPDTGLTGTVNAANVNLGPLALNNFVDGEDTYNLSITSGGNTVAVTLQGASVDYDFSLQGIASALANTTNATNLTQTSGTLANGVSYDISSGELVLTGPADGADIDLAETITDVLPATVPALPATVISGGNQAVFGTINIAPNSTTNVTLTGAGLADVGLTTDTLNGASGRIDLFTVLMRTEEAIRAGNFSDINGAGGSLLVQLDNLEIAANQNRGLRSSLGARAQRVESALLQREDAQIDLKQILSRYQDADILKVYNDIIQKESAFEAALNVTGRVSQISILDYL